MSTEDDDVTESAHSASKDSNNKDVDDIKSTLDDLKFSPARAKPLVPCRGGSSSKKKQLENPFGSKLNPTTPTNKHDLVHGTQSSAKGKSAKSNSSTTSTTQKSKESNSTDRKQTGKKKRENEIITYSERIELCGKSYRDAKYCLISLVETCLGDNDNTYFYIGKGRLSSEEGTNVDIRDDKTWNETAITKIVYSSKQEADKMKRGVDFTKQKIFILAALNSSSVPTMAKREYWQESSVYEERLLETYTLAIETTLISHYMFQKPNPYLANISIHPGRPSTRNKRKEAIEAADSVRNEKSQKHQESLADAVSSDASDSTDSKFFFLYLRVAAKDTTPTSKDDQLLITPSRPKQTGQQRKL